MSKKQKSDYIRNCLNQRISYFAGTTAKEFRSEIIEDYMIKGSNSNKMIYEPN